MLIILIHMLRLRSFGVPFMSPLTPLHFGDLKDVFIRVPWWGMKERPDEMGKKNPRRMSNGLHPHPPKRDE
ncbi:Spore germination protein XA [compost metagenome]